MAQAGQAQKTTPSQLWTSTILNQGPPVARAMEHGQVRAILGRHAAGPAHAASAAPAAPAAGARADPTLLVPASALRQALAARTAPEQRALARDYAALWARTFRTLARHLRGRPERALALFAEEIYPFLRGDRRAARVERVAGREARVLLPPDLPEAYHCGLLEGFVGLSGARARARHEGAGSFAVSYEVGPGDRLARGAQVVTALRLPLLACALLSALTAVALAATTEGWDARLAVAILVGVVAAQLGANTLHDLRRPAGSPLAPVGLARAVLRAANTLAYAAAAACAALIAWWSGPGILVFAAIGLLLGVAYARFRASGLGPLVAGVTYGLLIPAGALYAFEPAFLASPVVAPLFALPLGLMATALLLLDNIADRPLDEAGGQRTLAVRLGSHAQAKAFILLVALALAWLPLTAWPWLTPLPFVLVALLLVPAAWLAHRVWTRADDPRALAAPRLAVFMLLVAVALVPILVLGRGLVA